jgi:hypothetical protein
LWPYFTEISRIIRYSEILRKIYSENSKIIFGKFSICEKVKITF